MHDKTQPTPRQREIGALVVQELTNKQIAVRLGISEHTVGLHIASLIKRIGAHSKVGVALWAVKHTPALLWPVLLPE